MNSCELTAYITALANVLAECLTQKEIDLLSAILVQLGDTLETKSAFCSCKKNKG